MNELSEDPSQTAESSDQVNDRLKVLYRAGRLLASFESVEMIFPEILGLCGVAFPFVTAVLIRKKNAQVLTTVWTEDQTEGDRTERAVRNAKETFIYLTGASTSDSTWLRSDMSLPPTAEGPARKTTKEAVQRDNYFILPLAANHGPAFGILQLEGSEPLHEVDLEFVAALADLFAIGVDRFQRARDEAKRVDRVAKESSEQLSSSQAHIDDLRFERELREKFVTLLTHDLRTPLSSIRLNAQMIQLRVSGKPEVVIKMAGRMIASVDRADQMITNLLDANRIRSGEAVPLHIENVDLGVLLTETLDELSVIHGDRFRLVGDIPFPSGYWDPKALRRVVENLCTNAVKYGTADRTISVSVSREGKLLCISVHNFGNPVSPEDLKLLFLQFHRTDAAVRGSEKGWGIGLTVVQGVTEAHGGNVRVVSLPGTGTVFTVILPLDSRPFLSGPA